MPTLYCCSVALAVKVSNDCLSSYNNIEDVRSVCLHYGQLIYVRVTTVAWHSTKMGSSSSIVAQQQCRHADAKQNQCNSIQHATQVSSVSETPASEPQSASEPTRENVAAVNNVCWTPLLRWESLQEEISSNSVKRPSRLRSAACKPIYHT